MEASTAVASGSEAVSKPGKKSKEEILQAIKAKRTGTDVDTEKSKEEKSLNFKPIGAGFKPIGNSFKPVGTSHDIKKKKKKKTKDKGSIAKDDQQEEKAVAVENKEPEKEASSSAPPPLKPSQEDAIEAEPFGDDFDIFADAGEYEGISNTSDNEDDTDRPASVPSNHPQNRGGWFGDTDPTFDHGKITPDPEKITPPSTINNSIPGRAAQEPENTFEKAEDEETDIPTRLVPLASSVMPSIRDLLDADKATAKSHRKRKKRKGNGEGDEDDGGESNEKGKISAEARAERDYKRLKSFTQKKGGT
jgi:IK cytokine